MLKYISSSVCMKKVVIFWFVVVLLASCSDDDEVSKSLTAYDESVITYFNEIALGFELGGANEVTRKWVSDMKIFVGGTKTPEMMNELQRVVNELNELATDGFTMSLVTDTIQSNYYIFLGSGADYAEKFPSQAALVDDNWGLFSVYWDTSDQIYKGNMYVDITRANLSESKHLLREELTQSLGLAKDSALYPASIFQQSWTATTEFTSIDRDIIKLLYHPQMQVGLNEAQTEELLRQIILSEK